MKIALFHNLPSGGAKRHTYEQIRELSIRGNIVDEYVPSTADIEFKSLRPLIRKQYIYRLDKINIKQKRIPFITPYLHFLDLLKYYQYIEVVYSDIAQEIDENKYDVVLVKDCQITGNPSIMKFLRTPCLFQCHHGLNFSKTQVSNTTLQNKDALGKAKDFYYYPINFATKCYLLNNEKENIQSADRVITNSYYSKSLIKKHYHVNANVIYPGVNMNVFRPLNMERENFVLSVGALNYKKGFHFLIETLSKIDEKIRPDFLIISNTIDENYQDNLLRLAEQKKVNLSIETIRDDSLLVDRYNRASAFIYAPINEALGMAPLEAFACGLPVIAVDEGGVIETISGCSAGRLVPRDPELFAKAILDILLTENFKQLSLSAIEFIKNQWSWGDAVDKLTDELIRTQNNG